MHHVDLLCGGLLTILLWAFPTVYLSINSFGRADLRCSPRAAVSSGSSLVPE